MAIDLQGVRSSSWIYATPAVGVPADELVADSVWRQVLLPDFHRQVTVRVSGPALLAYPEGQTPGAPSTQNDGDPVDPARAGAAPLDPDIWHQAARRGARSGSAKVGSFFIAGDGGDVQVWIWLEDGK